MSQVLLPGLPAWVEVSGSTSSLCRKLCRRNRSRSDQPFEVDSRCADAARGSVSGLVSAAGGGAGNPQWLPELAGSGVFYHPSPQRSD